MIHLLFTGGTISMQRDPAAGGNVPAHGGERLVELAPGLARVGPFRIEDWARLPACHLGPDRLWALRERVREIQEGIGMPDGTAPQRHRGRARHRRAGGDRLPARAHPGPAGAGRHHRRHAHVQRRGMGRSAQPGGCRHRGGERRQRRAGYHGRLRGQGVRRAPGGEGPCAGSGRLRRAARRTGGHGRRRPRTVRPARPPAGPPARARPGGPRRADSRRHRRRWADARPGAPAP